MQERYFAPGPLVRIIGVQWGGAAEIATEATVIQDVSAEADFIAVTFSGWVKVPSGTTAQRYLPLFIFGSSIGIFGTAQSAQSAFEWVQASGETFGVRATFVGDPNDDGHVQYVEIASRGDSPFAFLPYGEWHHIFISANMADRILIVVGVGPEPQASLYVRCRMFINGVDQFPGPSTIGGFIDEPGYVRISPSIPTMGATMERINVTGAPVGLPFTPTTRHDWGPGAPLQFCDWQIYPRYIDPVTNIGHFFRMQDGVRKRMPTSHAEELFGVLTPDKFDPTRPQKKRALWMFRGGGGTFHKSYNRSTDGEFFKIGEIKTVKPPPVWKPA